MVEKEANFSGRVEVVTGHDVLESRSAYCASVNVLRKSSSSSAMDRGERIPVAADLYMLN